MEENSAIYSLREFNDYEEFCSWWGDNLPPPKSSLPPIGLVCGDMKAVGFLANTDTDFALITWWYANPEIKPRDKYMALKKVFQGLIDIAITIGKKNVFIYTSNRAMIRLLESLGFINYNGHLIARLDYE